MKLQTKPLSIKILLLIFWQAFPCLLIAQIRNLRFDKVETPDEAPLVSIDVIYEDSRGFIWFGGFAGLFMHDGNKINTFVNNPKDSLSISDNKVVGICEDAKGNLWIGTQNGMNYFNFKKKTFTRYNNQIKHGLGVEPINVIQKDKNNNIWVSTNYGLFLFDSINQRFNKNSAQSDSSVVARFAFFNKKVYFNSIAKNYTWNLKIKDIDSDSTEIITLPKPDNLILSLDEAGILWLSTRPGLYSINTSNINAPPTDYPLLKNEIIYTILKKNKDEIWFNSKNGLLYYNLKTSTLYNYTYNPLFPKGYPESGIYNAFLSSSNILWTQSKSFDLYTVDFNKNRFQSTPIKIMDNAEAPGILYEMYEYTPNNILVRQKNGTGILNILTGKISPFPYKPDYNLKGWQGGIICFADDKDNKVWIGTYGGLFLFDKNTKRFINLENPIKDFNIFKEREFLPRALHKDKKGNLWVATWNNGAYKVDFEKKTIKKYDWAGAARSIMETKEGEIWIGTRGGIGKYMANADTFKIYKQELNDPQSMSESTGFCMYEDEQKNIWVGTYGGGLNKLDTKTGKFKHYTTNEGLIDNNVVSMTPDKKGNLWLSTFGGISVFNPLTETFQNFNHKNGLLNKGYNAFTNGKSRFSERLFYGGDSGIDYFYPDSIKLSTFEPNVYITEFKLFNKPVSTRGGKKEDKTFYLDENINVTQQITLNYDQNVIGFDFAALDFSAPKNVKYAYILENFDTAWQYIGNNRSATFTNLNPGDYTFKVKATNADGVWGSKTASLKLTILAPWWQTWWFRSLVVLTLFSLGFAFYQYRISQIKEREAIKTTLNKQIAEVKMEALRSQMNPHFIFNALTSINLFILKNDTETASFYLNKFSKLMREVLDHSRSDLITVEEEINTLKIYVEIEKMRFRHNFNFVFDIQPTARISDIKIPPLIIQPYVENAIWHGLKHKKDGDALLKIIISEDSEYFYIIVEDNGIGRAKALALKQQIAKQHVSHGINVTEERIKQFNEAYAVQATVETIDLVSENQQPIGTQIVFEIKMT